MIVRKEREPGGAIPNLADYEAARRGFTWESARAELAGLPAGGLNIAHEAVDRHASGANGERVAIRWLSRDGRREDITYAALAAGSSRFANVLASLGAQPGDRVMALTGRIPELYVAALGTLKLRAIFSPLFAAFGPEPIKTRVNIAARVLVTTRRLYEKKIAPVRDTLSTIEHVLLVDGEAPGAIDLRERMRSASPSWTIAPTSPDDSALLHFTSGTTGTPKGALHVHGAVVMHHITGRLALDLHPSDTYWCTADPGWVTGTSYGIIAPLTNGVTMIVDEGDLDVERWYDVLEPVRRHRFPHLRFLASVGEPLDPEGVMWGVEAFGRPFHDNWWQTETGGIAIANFASMDVRPGSMGKPMPGIEATIVHRESGKIVEVAAPNEQGELALRPGWPSMFRAYWGAPERYARCFEEGWYLTGDLARRDADGYYWFVGRADDVIKSAGHLIGPFEVESTMLAHPAVAEAGVIGKPDPVAGEIVKAFVSLKEGFAKNADLERDLLAFARARLGPAVAPREITILDALPRTRSGKIMRRLLKARELGLPEGDTSMLEGAP